MTMVKLTLSKILILLILSRRPPLPLGTAALAGVRLASMSLPGRATGQTRQYQSES